MAIIRVPKTPKRAFNKNRPASTLLRSQIEHLEWAVRPASERKPRQLPRRQVKTEGEAAARIEQLTRLLHPEGAKLEPAADFPQAVTARPKKKRAKSRARRRPQAR
jgi:hypothetical protein